jgi:hypothetical protein
MNGKRVEAKRSRKQGLKSSQKAESTGKEDDGHKNVGRYNKRIENRISRDQSCKEHRPTGAAAKRARTAK